MCVHDARRRRRRRRELERRERESARVRRGENFQTRGEFMASRGSISLAGPPILFRRALLQDAARHLLEASSRGFVFPQVPLAASLHRLVRPIGEFRWRARSVGYDCFIAARKPGVFAIILPASALRASYIYLSGIFPANVQSTARFLDPH